MQVLRLLQCILQTHSFSCFKKNDLETSPNHKHLKICRSCQLQVQQSLNSLPSKQNTVAQLFHVMAKASEQTVSATANCPQNNQRKQVNPYWAAEQSVWGPCYTHKFIQVRKTWTAAHVVVAFYSENDVFLCRLQRNPRKKKTASSVLKQEKGMARHKLKSVLLSIRQ